MALIIRISINNKELKCYAAQRITNTGMITPHDTSNKYKITECYSQKHIGYVTHKFDDPPEKLAIKALKLVKS